MDRPDLPGNSVESIGRLPLRIRCNVGIEIHRHGDVGVALQQLGRPGPLNAADVTGKDHQTSSSILVLS